jgi:hypothetical protein
MSYVLSTSLYFWRGTSQTNSSSSEGTSSISGEGRARLIVVVPKELVVFLARDEPGVLLTTKELIIFLARDEPD